MTVFDEDWTEEDMRDALHWQTEQALICPGCGGFTDETMAVGRDDDFDAELLACHRCAAGERAERMFRSDPHAVTDGLRRRTFEVED